MNDGLTTDRGFASAVAAGAYVALTMSIYGLSESLATHRVRIVFDLGSFARVFAVAATLAAFALLAGWVACRLQRHRPAHLRTAVLGLSLGCCAGYVAFVPSADPTLAGLTAVLALVLWRFVGSDRAGLGWIAFTPLTLATIAVMLYQFPPIASVWLCGMIWSVVNGASLLVHTRLQDLQGRRAALSMAGLVALAGVIAASLPWPLATHYSALKIFPTAAIAFAGGSLIWLMFPGRRMTSLASAIAVAVSLGAVLHGVFLSQGRAAAFGSYSFDTMVGKGMQWLYLPRDAAQLERSRLAAHPTQALTCPNDPRPTGVLWVVVDALRADAFTPEQRPALAAWAAESTTFTNAYAPAQATYTSFATWLPNLPDQVGVPWKIMSARHPRAELTTALASPATIVAQSCTDEGLRFAQLADELAAGTLGLVYMPVPHNPYLCTEPMQPPETCYANAVDCVVEQLEPVLDWARENPDWAVVVTSDHGESFGEKGVRYHAIALWEEQVRVPLFIRAPGWARGKTVTTAVSNAWLSGTIGCWLGQGASAFGGPAGLLNDAPKGAPFALHGYSVFYGKTMWGWGSTRESAVVDWPYKLIIDRDTDFAQLFDLERDPDETRNVADLESARVGAMASELDGLWGPPLTKRTGM